MTYFLFEHVKATLYEQWLHVTYDNYMLSILSEL